MYVSYEYFKAAFGGTIPEAAFPVVEAKAEAHISYFTYPNGDIFATADVDRVKLAVCAAAEVVYYNNLAASGQGAAKGVKSESNDGYSVTYVVEAQDGQTAEEALRKKVYEAVKLYLLPTGWLRRKVNMRGGCCDECADEDYCL